MKPQATRWADLEAMQKQRSERRWQAAGLPILVLFALLAAYTVVGFLEYPNL